MVVFHEGTTNVSRLTRAECRTFAQDGAGYWRDMGGSFVLRKPAVPLPVDPLTLIRETPKTHGESATIQPRTMEDYVDGRPTAIAAVDFWEGKRSRKRLGVVVIDGMPWEYTQLEPLRSDKPLLPELRTDDQGHIVQVAE